MKTLEEVKAHVHDVGYNQLAIQKIEGFLLGNGLLGEEFEMEYMIGERTFDDFRAWFNSEKKEECKKEIDWNEFGLGDFVHIEDGIDVVLLGGIHNGKVVCVNEFCDVHCLFLIEESRPCNEEEIEFLVKKFNERGISFCFAKNEFISKPSCEECIGCDVKESLGYDINELYKNYEELCKIAESISEGNPCKEMAKAIVEMVGQMIKDVNESIKDNSELIDELEIGAKEAIENIIANLHEGNMNEKEKESVVDALKVLVELGKMYE